MRTTPEVGFVANSGQVSLFTQRLKHARELAGITQYQLGLRAGLDERVAGPRINQYENGIHQPRQEMVLDLAEALGVPAAFLSTQDDVLARLLLSWLNLTNDQRLKHATNVEADAAHARGTSANLIEADAPSQKGPACQREEPSPHPPPHASTNGGRSSRTF